MTKQAFALSADYGYINQLETTAKSILYHHAGATIYVINTDIPQEWFSNINRRLAGHGKLINRRIIPDILKNEHVSQPQINEMSYGRILIPDLIPDEERILYLDSDIVVNGDLSPLFELDMGDHPIAAVEDLLYQGKFNSGVLLFNMPILKKTTDIVHQMLEAGLADDLSEGDQSVLNQFFDKTYLHLPLKYNYAIGYDFLCFYYPGYNHDFFKRTGAVKDPKIVHFTGPWKPWRDLSTGRMRNVWWQYHDLEWLEVAKHAQLPATWDYDEDASCFILTNSEDVKEIETLVEAFPNCTFNIAAFTGLGSHLTRLMKYSNVHLYTSIVEVEIDRLIKEADFFLDTNYGAKDDNTLKKEQATGKPILSFDEVKSGLSQAINYEVFDNDDADGMVERIKAILNNR